MRTLTLLFVLPALATSCGLGFDTWFDGRCFKSWNYGQTFHHDAVQQCAMTNGHPPIIRSAEDNKLVYDMARKMTQGLGPQTNLLFWIGITCDGTNYVWPDGSIANYTNFDDPESCTPQNAKDLFFFLSEDYFWHTSGNVLFGVDWVVCEAKYLSESKCDDYEEVPNSVDDCYILQTGATSAYSAELACKMTGTHLASVHNKNMHEFMRRTAVGNGYASGMHIGMAMLDYMHFSWTDKSPVDFTNYGPGEPDDTKGSCVKMTTDTVEAPWMVEQCMTGSLPYMCSKKAIILSDPQQPAGCPTNAQYKAADHIYSPSFPTAGGPALCEYRIGEAEINTNMQVDILFFESNQCCDSLQICDTDGKELAMLSGAKLNSKLSYRATGNTMTLRWNATSGVHVRGFHAVVGIY